MTASTKNIAELPHALHDGAQFAQRLMGIDNLVVAGSHGFDIWAPTTGTVARDASLGFEDLVDGALAAYPGQLKITPGKMVYEVQPKIDWDKGKAVLHLLHALGLESDDVVAVYVGDDITDEDAFLALAGRGIGILVAGAGEPAEPDRETAADFVLDSIGEVERFLRTLSC